MSLMTWTRTAGDYSPHVDTGLAGKVVLVTGGAGGIGSECVRAFAAEGARVVIHYNTSRERAEALAAELPGAVAIGADLTDEAAVDSLFTRAREELGDIDVCAAVAGVWPRDDEPVWRMSLARWDEVLRANLTATFLTARGFLREVERSGHGNLVLVGSTAGRFGEAGHSDYAAAKSAIQVGLLLSLKNEIVRIAPGGRVNAVAPGWTYSPMTRGALDPAVVDRISRTMALRKVAMAEDIARAVVVLASDEFSGHITGELVTVAGGMEGRTLHS
jgi:3-oxoacyl-[acyl-carrier protein] reductase